MKSIEWNDYEDSLDWQRFILDGYAESSRKYKKNGQFLMNSKFIGIRTSIPSKGISAFLSCMNYPPSLLYDESLFLLIKYEKPKPLEDKIFPNYYETCLIHLRKKEKKRELFEKDRRTEKELIKQHINDEIQFFKDSDLLYNEFLEERGPIIEKIKKAALYYITWVEKTHLIENKDKNDNPTIGNGDSGLGNESHEQRKHGKKLGKKGVDPQPVAFYIRKINIKHVNNFIDKLKIDYKNSKPVDFIYMLNALYRMGILQVDNLKEVFIAFSNYFGGKYGCLPNFYARWHEANATSKKGSVNIKLKQVIDDISQLIVINKIEYIE